MSIKRTYFVLVFLFFSSCSLHNSKTLYKSLSLNYIRKVCITTGHYKSDSSFQYDEDLILVLDTINNGNKPILSKLKFIIDSTKKDIFFSRESKAKTVKGAEHNLIVTIEDDHNICLVWPYGSKINFLSKITGVFAYQKGHELGSGSYANSIYFNNVKLANNYIELANEIIKFENNKRATNSNANKQKQIAQLSLIRRSL